MKIKKCNKSGIELKTNINHNKINIIEWDYNRTIEIDTALNDKGHYHSVILTYDEIKELYNSIKDK